MKKHSFTNSEGETFSLSSLNPLEEQLVRTQLEREWKEAGKKLPQIPTYEAVNAAGEKFVIALKDEKEADTDALKAAWAEYKALQAELENEYSERFMVSCFACVEANPDDFPAWKMRMKMRRLDIPEDAADKQILFGKTWVIRSTDDITGLIIACTRTMANISDEAAKAAEDMFRRQVEGSVASLTGAG